MTLTTFLEEVDRADHTLAVVGDQASGPLGALLEESVGESSIDVNLDIDADIADFEFAFDVDPSLESELDRPTDDDIVLLLEDETVVAVSPLAALYEHLLAVNSDLYVTGTQGLGDVELPDVLAGLDDTRLTLRGYPLAHKEKLLLIVVSRYIEQLAWEAGSGTLRSSFQYLSRIDDEIGTRAVYESLAATDLALHVYGVADSVPSDLECIVHAGDSDDYRDAWFVVFRPDRDPGENGCDGNARGAALLALETESRIWDGFWTDDPARIARIDEYLERTL
ncbi:histidine kinase [Halobacteria archaeon AArc-m2/3/4]|uniref:Histidine kinase n=1 Tax=Natronoglomus mannanivorans TaxID=2979990 RepID=A0AAP2YVS4_9EURY|nr:histidine kinase [Halobacteria archaeon AArc-xg1-1]MCU4973022.1 histidine kinase [Halobacteria archaeon AArc-m2/3/4]